MVFYIKLCVIALSLYVIGRLALMAWREGPLTPPLSFLTKLKFAFSSFIANIADTLGIGSFAVVVAFNKYWNLVDDRQVPGTLNAHSILPAMCQAVFFLQAVPIDTETLITLVTCASLGGFFGGYFVSRLDKQKLRRLMFLGYVGIATLILSSKLGLLPIGGELMSLQGIWLASAAVGVMLAGALPAIGVGSYAPTQVILFLLGMSPLAAFPVMTASAAIQQSVAALAFIIREQVALKPSLIMNLAGVAGVLVAAPILTYVNLESLRWLLLAVVLYNVHMLWKAYAPQTKLLSETT